MHGDTGLAGVSRRRDNPPAQYRAVRGRRVVGPYHPGSHGGVTGGGEAKMDCSGNKRGGKKKR